MIILGKALFGFSVGMYICIVPKIIEETVPEHLFGTMIGTYMAVKQSASFSIFLLSYIMPSDSDTEALRETDNWIILSLYIPLGLQFIVLLSLILVFRYEPIRFLIH